MRKKIFAALLCAAVLSSSLTGCSSGLGSGYDDGFSENILRVTYDHECESADPRQTTADYILALNLFDTLFVTEATPQGGSQLVPGVAHSCTVSPDGTTYSIELKQGIRFTNGEEMTSDDVLYTIDSMLDPERNSLNSYWMDMISGAKDVLEGKASTVKGRGMIIHDDYSFDLILSEAYAPFLSTLSSPAWSILNREACEAADLAGGGKTSTFFGSQPEYTIGSGPFILKEWSLNDHIYLQANPDYWQGPPSLDGVLIKVVTDAETERMMFEQGQIDIFELDHAPHLISEYTSSPQWKDCIVRREAFGVEYLSINQSIPPFDDVRIRKALQMAVDRQTLIDTLYQGSGTPAGGIYPCSMSCYNEALPPIPYDPSAARALLSEAGYPDGFSMTIASKSSDSDASKELLQILQAQWEEIGVHVTIEQMDEASWYDIRSAGELPMYKSSWWGDFNDPDNFIYNFFSSESTKARSFHYKNEDAIRRIEAARHMTDEAKRMEEYKELEKIVIQEDAAWIPLVHPEKIRVVQPRVKGFLPHWAGWGDCSYYSVELSSEAKE